MNGKVPFKPLVVAVSFAALLSGCYQMPPMPPEGQAKVSVLKVQAAEVTLADELPGRVVAFRVAEIRPQVSGIVRQMAFGQGSHVAAGQVLFQIDPAPFKAEANSAAAVLKRSEAVLENARLQVQRLKSLSETDAISRQSYDNAMAAQLQAEADVAQARSALERRQLDVKFASVTSPISGQIGAANITEGALVGTADAKPMAVVQQIDQVYVDVRQPVSRIQALREAASRGDAAKSGAIEVLSGSGKVYHVKGKLLFSDISVDPETGDAIVRLVVPNQDQGLLPGMFVRARLPRQNASAIKVPQQSVVRDAAGQAQVYVLGQKNTVTTRPVVVGDVVNGEYVILDGLKAGETVLVEGMGSVAPGVPVKPVTWQPVKSAK